MRNIRIIFQYDGTDYCGWQRQKNGISVQEKLEDALFERTRERRPILASGRTDSGVHAFGQSANFYTESTIPVERFHLVLNSALPDDIRVRSAQEVSMNFHSIRDAVEKTYTYRLYQAREVNVFRSRFAWHFPEELDDDRMKKAAELLLGTHDFLPFSRIHKTDIPDGIRTLKEAKIERMGDEVLFTFTADGFLYNMVRILVGALTFIGRGKAEPEEILQRFSGERKTHIGYTVPACGLTLMNVTYPDELLDPTFVNDPRPPSIYRLQMPPFPQNEE